jgi:hypothetical protein
LFVVWSTLSLSLAAVAGASPATADSFRTSNDNSFTGWYPNQPLLTPSAAGGGTFGSLFNATLSGKIYAQQLVSQGKVLAVTENDYACGVDTSTGVVSWTNNYGPAATPTVDVNARSSSRRGLVTYDHVL